MEGCEGAITVTTTCECNGKDYTTKGRLNAHTKTNVHRVWALTKRCEQLVHDVKRRDNKISGLELTIANRDDEMCRLVNRLETYEEVMKMTLESMKSHEAGADKGKVSELEVKLAKSRESTDIMKKELERFKTMEEDFERFKTIAFLTGALDV